MATRKDKLDTLAESEGITVDQMLEAAVVESVVPGICVRDGCDYSVEIEPDCRAGYCEECDRQSVKSCLVLAGLI